MWKEGVAMAIATLPVEWKARAKNLRRWASAEAAATAWERAAAELEEALSRQSDRVLDLTQAAAVSGYSADHLGRLIRQGRIPNAGRRHAPRIRLSDLPRKPGHAPTPAERLPETPPRDQVVRTLLQRRQARADG